MYVPCTIYACNQRISHHSPIARLSLYLSTFQLPDHAVTQWVIRDHLLCLPPSPHWVSCQCVVTVLLSCRILGWKIKTGAMLFTTCTRNFDYKIANLWLSYTTCSITLACVASKRVAQADNCALHSYLSFYRLLTLKKAGYTTAHTVT